MLTVPLYPYQDPAVDKFLARGRMLVAYEMGLGKTPIAIACAEELLGCGDIHTCLLVVPAGLRYQWAQELAKFTDLPTMQKRVGKEWITIPTTAACPIIDGTPDHKKLLLRQAIEAKPDYVIMSYEQVVKDTRAVKRLGAGFVVLDEASAIKTFGSDRTLTIKRTLKPDYRVALTGTPVENRAEECFSIMEWVDEECLGPFDLFEKTFIERWHNGSVKRTKNVPLLNHKLSQSMVRRSRRDPDVAKYLPEVDHGQWYCGLDQQTRDRYAHLAGDLLNSLLSLRTTGSFDIAAYYSGAGHYDETTGLGKIMSRQQAIELLLAHPRLVHRSARLYEETEDKGSKYCHEIVEAGIVNVTATPKLDYLLDKLEPILEFEENKVLVFSQWPEMLSLISERLGVPAVRYHGGMSATAKAAAIESFRDPAVRVFLSSNAGAYGTNMSMVNYLINYDLPWSGGMWDQRNGRHQRASSEFDQVYIRDIICDDTVEVRKLSMLQYKQRLAAGVVDGKVKRSGDIENDLVSLTDFLQGG